MKLDFATLAFGYTVLAGGNTPNWATSLGQSRAKQYRINDDYAINELLKGMTYCSVPVTNVSTRIGKGGSRVSGKEEGNPIVSAAVFSNVYINDTPITGGKFILLITRDTSSSHYGRLRIKYGPGNAYTNGEETYSNEKFFIDMKKQLGLADDACFFVSEIIVVNQSDLVLKTFIVNKHHSVEYSDGQALRSAWESLADFNVELPEEVIEDEEPNIPVTDYSENEKRFREWMLTQTNSRGVLCKPGMVSKNATSLTKVCSLMDIVEYPDLESIFQITNMDVFYEIKDIIKSHPDYPSVDSACSNGYLNTSLKWYEKYLNEILLPEIITPKTDAEEYSKAKFLSDVFMNEDEYEQLTKLLIYKKNIILQGAPGVGKTYLAKKLAYSILGKKDDTYIEMVQFHQNYSYEDFIMGYKPVDEGFDLKMGVFYNFCKKAASEPESKFFFIIDEINRGNLSKIFGELMMLIEGDKRGEENQIKLAYKNEQFYVPANVYIIGMMNTADRSLAMMDYALRRRFSFFDVLPAFERESFKNHLLGYVGVDVANKVVKRFKELNAKIADENSSNLGKGYCIGHSYFCVRPVKGQSDTEWYDTIVEYEIAPLLYEYWWDDKDRADECINELKK